MKSDNWSKRGQGIVLTWTRAYKYRGQTCDNTEDEGVTIPRTKPRPKEETEYSINQPIKHHTQIAVYSWPGTTDFSQQQKETITLTADGSVIIFHCSFAHKEPCCFNLKRPISLIHRQQKHIQLNITVIETLSQIGH